MINKLGRYLGLLIILILFSGCNKRSSQENKPDSDSQEVNADSVSYEGNYTEIELPQPKLTSEEKRIGSRINEKNQFELYTCLDTNEDGTKVYCYTLVDEDFQKVSVGWIEKACKELNASPDELCQSEDGNEYIQCVKTIPMEDGTRRGTDILIMKSEDGEDYQNITPSFWYDETSDNPYYYGPFISKLRITKERILCYKEDNHEEITFYDLNENETVDYKKIIALGDYVVNDNKLYYIDVDKHTIQVVDLVNNESEQIILTPQNQTDLYKALLQVMDNNDIILLDSNGLHVMKHNGTLWETIVDGKKNSMSMPNYQTIFFGIALGESNTYYAIYDNITQGIDDLYVKYKICTDDELTPSKELTICALYDNPTVKYSIDRFKREHPDVEINYDVIMPFQMDKFYNSEYPYDILPQDAVRTLNAEILSGKCPDVLILDELPIDSYIEKGVLMDISDVFQNKEIAVIQNISNYYTVDNKIYCMPARLYVPLYATYEDITSHTNTVEDIADYCEENNYKFREACSYDRLVNLFLTTYSEEIFAEDGKINKEKLASFLQSTDMISKQIGCEEEIPQMWHPCYDNGIVPEISNRMINIFMGIADSLMWDHQYLLSTISIGNNREIMELMFIMSLMDGTYQTINQTFAPSSIVGITQTTPNPELAKEFVTMLFSDEVQHCDLWDGFPVNEQSLNGWVKDGDSIGLYMYTKENGVSSMQQYDRVTAENMQSIVDLIKSLDHPIYNDIDGKDIIVTIATEYLKGDKSLEQAVNEITQKYDIYLSE